MSANRATTRVGPTPSRAVAFHDAPTPLDWRKRAREWEGLFRRWLRKEEFCQANLGADIVLEAAYAGEVMKDIGSDRKIPSERKLELEMAAQVVVFT